ncbi:MAG: hypothetical protein Q4P08_02245 [Eubacteriales bacterium]|nr:hypothetical protein [Eubacteriales bacterium]
MDRKDALNYLNLAEDASTEEIRQRYLELLAEYDPSQYKDPGMIQLSERYTDELNAAYDALTSDRFTGASSFPEEASRESRSPFGSSSERYQDRGQASARDSRNSARGANWTSWNKSNSSQIDSGCLRQLCCFCAWFSCLRRGCCFVPFTKNK